MKKTILILCLILVLLPVFAGKTYYHSGDTFFVIRVGSGFPFLTAFPNDENSEVSIGTGLEEGQVGLSATVAGSLSYQSFLNSRVALGGEIGYQLNFSRIDGHYFTQVPFTFKASYLPIQTGKFDVVMNANLGYAYVKFLDAASEIQGSSSLFASFTLQPTLYIGKSWGLGLEAGISGFYEMHTKNNTKADAVLLTVPATLVVSYRH